MVPARTWRRACSRDGSYGKEKLRRQMGAAGEKKGTTSLSLFMEAFGLVVEEHLSTLVHQVLGRRGMDWNMASVGRCSDV